MSPEKAENVRDRLTDKTYLNFDVTRGVQPGPSFNVTVYSEKDVEQSEMKEMIIYALATS
jgi:hypothetical protein